MITINDINRVVRELQYPPRIVAVKTNIKFQNLLSNYKQEDYEHIIDVCNSKGIHLECDHGLDDNHMILVYSDRHLETIEIQWT